LLFLAATTTTISTTTSYYYPCRSNIAILIDASRGISQDNFVQEINFISNALVMSNWTNFERIGIAEYGSIAEFNAYNYGTISNFNDFQNIIENSMTYLGDATPNITGYITFMYIII